MASRLFQGRLALRLDIDFPLGLSRAVPRFLDRLGAAGMRATFFVVAGENRASMRRLLRRDYWRRLTRLGPARTLARLVVPSAGRPAGFLSSEDARDVLRRIVDEGHELAVHGYDHAWWADNVWESDEERIAEQIDRAYAALQRYDEHTSLAWGSPSWRTSDAVLRRLEQRGVPYFADCWGREPFRTLDRHGVEIGPPHLPITLPSLETQVLEHGCCFTDAVARVLGARTDGCFELLCVHDYFEGLLHPALFDHLIDALRAAHVRTITLREAARAIEEDRCPLPLAGLDRRPLAGFSGLVSWQAQASPGPE